MNKTLLCLAALLVAAPAISGESRIHSTRDSGGYEATLRQAGIPLAGGLAWATHPAKAIALRAGQPVAAIRAESRPAG